MKHDRLRQDKDDIRNVEDLIDAREERTTHIASDTDSLDTDLDIPDDFDASEALTFPHPKHKESPGDVELMHTPHKEDIGDTEADQDIQPTDYEEQYDEAITTYATDDMEQVAEEHVHEMGHIPVREIEDEEETEVMPGHFTPDEETRRQSS